MSQINLLGVAQDWFKSRVRSPHPNIDMHGLNYKVQNMEWKKKTAKPTIQSFSRDVNISNETGRQALAAIHTELSHPKSVKFTLKSATLKGLTRRVPLPLDKSLSQEVFEQFFDLTDIDLGQMESEISGVTQKQDSIEQMLSFENTTARLPFLAKEFKADFKFDLAVTGGVTMLRGNTQPFHRIVSDMRNEQGDLRNLIVGEDEVLIPVEGSARFCWVTVNSINWK